MVDTRVESSAVAMRHDLEAGEIDAGVLWGPLAGYYARQASSAMAVVPLVKERIGPPLAYRIAMGVRSADQEWKRSLNRLIAENQPAINRPTTERPLTAKKYSRPMLKSWPKSPGAKGMTSSDITAPR